MFERNAPSPSPLRLRTVFISDIHLGFKGCSADLLLDFLHHVEMDSLFLVGDIIDVWSMKKTMYWPQSHNNVLRTILGKAKRGTKVIFVPGNHDEVFREFDGAVFGNLEIHREYIHRGADGRSMLVLHGDEFDSVVKCSPWLAKLGSDIYDVLLAANPYINWVRRKFGLPHWSLSSYLKNKAKTAVQYIGSFEDAVAQAARKRGVDTVVSGRGHERASAPDRLAEVARTGSFTGHRAAGRPGRLRQSSERHERYLRNVEPTLACVAEKSCLATERRRSRASRRFERR
jgi:UDP-2,3-diacylglucosamine pyrophosphatase LpxH